MGRWGLNKAAAILACAALWHAASAAPAAAVEERPGAALRAAIATREAGQPVDAAAAFERAAERWPVVGDHALRLAAEAWLEAGDADHALEAAVRIVREHPQSPLDTESARLEAEAHLARGETSPALDAYRRAHSSARTTEERRVLRASLAQTLEDAGQPTAAHENWLVIWRQVPGSPEDELALAALARLEAEGLPAPSAAAWAQRAKSLAEAHDAVAAVAAYDRALAGGLPDRMQKQLHRERAFALFRARKYPEALAAFEALGPDAEARLYRARSLARSGQRELAIEAFETVGRGRSREAWRARFLVATLLDDVPETRDRAAAHYAAVAASGPDARERRSAAWRLAWLQRTEGKLAEAAAAFERLTTGDPIAALQPRYWAARTRAEIDPAAPEPRAEFVEIARRYPLSYYGWRAAGLVAGAEGERPEPVSLARGQQRLGGAPVARVRILVEAGLSEAAGDEVVRLESRARTLADRLLLASLAEEAGRPDRARVLAARGNEVALARGPAPGLEQLWWHAWPRPWQAQVESAGRGEGVDPRLVWAVMREESGFRHAVVSPAGAHGLLQLMPETAERLAPDLGTPGPLPQSLHDPGVNIRFGTHLLGKLATRFGARRSAAIGGYNAGAAVVEGWLAERPQLPDDEWVESIPYDETRGYVRRVLRSFHAYRVLY